MSQIGHIRTDDTTGRCSSNLRTARFSRAAAQA